jgi:hypothetical protein
MGDQVNWEVVIMELGGRRPEGYAQTGGVRARMGNCAGERSLTHKRGPGAHHVERPLLSSGGALYSER